MSRYPEGLGRANLEDFNMCFSAEATKRQLWQMFAFLGFYARFGSLGPPGLYGMVGKGRSFQLSYYGQVWISSVCAMLSSVF